MAGKPFLLPTPCKKDGDPRERAAQTDPARRILIPAVVAATRVSLKPRCWTVWTARVHTGQGNFLSWRLLTDDAPSMTLNVYRDGTTKSNPVYREAVVWQGTACNQPPHASFTSRYFPAQRSHP